MSMTQPPQAEKIQLFNEAVLGSSPTAAIPILLTNLNSTWSPKQIILDIKDNACYGAMIHYERSYSFESLRGAINRRFRGHENATFANDPKMGIWRMEDAGFAIQLSDNDELDSYMVIYTFFVDLKTMGKKLEELHAKEPSLFNDVPVECFIDNLKEGSKQNDKSQDSR